MLALAREAWAAIRGVDRRVAAVCCAGALVALLDNYQGSNGFFREVRWGGAPPLAADVYWFGASFVLWFVLPLAGLVLARQPLREYGVGLGDARAGAGVAAALLAVMLPVIFVASRSPAFYTQYPMSVSARAGGRTLLVYELFQVGYFVGWEFLWRGLFVNGLGRRVGAANAILLSMVPFAVMHAGKPEAEALGSIPAGIALGMLAWRTRSFWWGALLHVAAAASMDLFALLHRPAA